MRLAFQEEEMDDTYKVKNIYIYVNPVFPFIPPSSFPYLMSIHLLSMFVSLLLLCRYVHLYYFF